MPKINLSQSPNAQMIKSVQTKGVLSSNARTVQDIPLELIDENADNASVFNMEEIERLAKNIETEGFFGTIEVYLKDDGRYEISSGHRRFRAMRLLGKSTIPATVTPMPEQDTKKRRKLIASNINSRNMTPIDWARAMQYYYDTLQMEDAQARDKEDEPEEGVRYRARKNRIYEVAQYFGVAERSVTRYLSLNKLIPELQALVEQKIVPWTALDQACKLSVEKQRLLLQAFEDTLSCMKGFNGEKEDCIVTLNGTQVEHIIERFVLNGYRLGNPSAEEKMPVSEPKSAPKKAQPKVPEFTEREDAVMPSAPIAYERFIDDELMFIKNRLTNIAGSGLKVKDAGLVSDIVAEIKELLKNI